MDFSSLLDFFFSPHGLYYPPHQGDKFPKHLEKSPKQNQRGGRGTTPPQVCVPDGMLTNFWQPSQARILRTPL